MENTTLAVAAEFIQSGIEKTGIPLTGNLQAYLAITFSRFIDRTIEVDRLTVRVTDAFERNAPRDQLRMLADECLISCGLFEQRLRRNGNIRTYVGLGQTTYDAAGMTEQAYGFVHMRDIIAHSRTNLSDVYYLIDEALAGSVVARRSLDNSNIIVGPWNKQKWL